MAPLVKALQSTPQVEVKVCVTAQHRQMLDQVLELFEIKPDFDLNLMKENQGLADLSAEILQKMTSILSKERPDWVFVHGDTSTTFITTLAAFYLKIPVAHVEAGLRTGDLMAPWPEEANRLLTGRLAALHFAPTEKARQHLLAEGVDAKQIWVTGNTVIDALECISTMIDEDTRVKDLCQRQFRFLSPEKKLILVTGHRRENFGQPIKALCEALKKLAEREDVEIVYPVHLNPNVTNLVHDALDGTGNIHLIEPLDYLSFVYLLKSAFFIITDSGGIQEEAPALGKPVLVTREKTERPEAIEAGTALLVGTNTSTILGAAGTLLEVGDTYKKMATAVNPFGDGYAAKRIVQGFMDMCKL